MGRGDKRIRQMRGGGEGMRCGWCTPGKLDKKQGKG